MKQSRLKTTVRVIGVLIICLGLVIIAGLIYFGKIQFPFLPTTAEYTFESGSPTDWDSGIGLKMSLPPLPPEGRMRFRVKRSAPEQQPEGDFIITHSVYDITFTSENLQEIPVTTYSFEIPEGVESQAAVILYWTEEGWTLADNESGSPGGDVSSDGKYISITRRGASKYSIAEWLYVKILSHLDGLPNPPPPDPIIEAKDATPSTDYPGCYTSPGCLVSEVHVESPIYKDVPLLGKFGATWYYIDITTTENVSISGPDLPGYSPYLDPGEKQELQIAFPYTGGRAHLCLDTSKALGWAAKSWAEDLFILPEVLDESIFIGEIMERFQGRHATVKDMFWVIKKVLIDNFWKLTGNRTKFIANVVPVSINIAVYINGWIDREVSCVDITATPPQETTPSVETPTLSPTPTERIAFVSDRNGNQEIYLMELVGSTVVSLTNLTNNPADDYDPVWSPDGNRIAFISERDGTPDIYMMNIKDSITFRLTYDAGRESNVAWSPDGNRIMFVSDQEGNREINMVNSDGSNHVNLTNNSDDDCCPSWSPDGKYILFIRGRLSLDDFPKSYIFLMRVDGATETFLYDYPPYNWGNSLWFPDGKQIALVAYPPGGEDPSAAFYIINIENPDISPSLIYIGHEFSLSPDFTSIATILPKNCDPYRDEKCEKGIFTMSIDGSSTNCLTCNNMGWDYEPRWSPDDSSIVFVSDRDGNKEIYLMDADGSCQVNLTNNPANDWGSVWAPIPLIYSNISESTAETTNPTPSLSCPGALPTRLKAGGYAYVSLDPPLANRVRNGPGKNYSVVGSVQPGKIMEITDGPECADNWIWWKIRELETNLVGWTAEGDNQGYWLVPCASEIECGNH